MFPQSRRSPTTPIVTSSDAYVVRSNWDREAIWAVYRCERCHERHVVTAPVDADSVRRRTACGLGSVVVVFGVVRSEPPR